MFYCVPSTISDFRLVFKNLSVYTTRAIAISSNGSMESEYEWTVTYERNK